MSHAETCSDVSNALTRALYAPGTGDPVRDLAILRATIIEAIYTLDEVAADTIPADAQAPSQPLTRPSAGP